MQQLTAEGVYTGGPVPFGYCNVKNGRLNKKGREVLDIAVEPREAEWVKKLYQLIVIGANDVVNPSAINDETSPLYGMPIINAFAARTVFVLKRGKGAGFSGVENQLFTNDNTVMIYGDAKQTVSALVSEFDET